MIGNISAGAVDFIPPVPLDVQFLVIAGGGGGGHNGGGGGAGGYRTGTSAGLAKSTNYSVKVGAAVRWLRATLLQ
jgi:hypothetical protein